MVDEHHAIQRLRELGTDRALRLAAELEHGLATRETSPTGDPVHEYGTQDTARFCRRCGHSTPWMCFTCHKHLCLPCVKQHIVEFSSLFVGHKGAAVMAPETTPDGRPLRGDQLMNAIPDMVCRLCGEPINRWTKQSGEEWKHGRMEGYDHEPDPIPLADALTVNYMCDFCSGDGVRWFYPTGTRITHTLKAVATVDEEVHGISYHRRTRAKQVHSIGSVRQDVVAPKSIADNVFSDNWAACDPCSAVVELDDVERLVTHLRRRNSMLAAVSRKVLKDHFSEFCRLRQPRRPIEEANQ